MAMVLKINDEAIKTIKFTESMPVAPFSDFPDEGAAAVDPMNLFQYTKIVNQLLKSKKKMIWSFVHLKRNFIFDKLKVRLAIAQIIVQLHELFQTKIIQQLDKFVKSHKFNHLEQF